MTATRRDRRIAALLLALLLAAAAAGCRERAGDGAARATAGADTLPRFGYLSTEMEAAAAIVLVAWEGSDPPVPGVTRSREEARELADRLAAQARQSATIAELAARYSDDRQTALAGGYAGIIRKGSWPIPLEIVLFQLPVGGIGGPVETPQGFVIVQRLPVLRIPAHHILIAWRGALRAGPSVTRTEEQARLLAEEVRRLAVDGKQDPCDLAARYSDDLANRFRCGLLGEVEPYALLPELGRALKRLRPGELSPPVRTPYGYHLLWRDASPAHE